MANCSHRHTTESVETCFCGDVRPDDPNPAAHGSVTWTETCTDCGAERGVNGNQGHREWGHWSPSADEQRRTTEAQRELRAEWVGAGRPSAVLADGRALRVIARRRDGVILSLGGKETLLSWPELIAAARQHDARLAGIYSAARRDALALPEEA